MFDIFAEIERQLKIYYPEQSERMTSAEIRVLKTEFDDDADYKAQDSESRSEYRKHIREVK